MPRLSLGLGIQNSRKIKSGGSAPTIWKVAIFGAGDGYSDAEYIWDGSTMSQGKNIYLNFDGNILSFDEIWFIDIDGIGTTYTSNDLITWSTGQSLSPPAPLSALSYSQTSYIQTVVLAGGTPDQSGTYTWDGTTFVNGRPKYFGPLKSGAPENNYIYWNTENYMLYGFKVDEMTNLSSSADLVSIWIANDALVEPTVSNIIYTA
jgi:hypothetical protein